MENLSNKIDSNYSKNYLNTIFCFHNYSKIFCEYIRLEHQDFKNENIEKKYIENMQNNQFLRVKNSLLELEKDFMEMKDIELKDRKEEIKKEIEKLFNNPIIVSKDDMDKFEEHEMKKIRQIIRNWFHWLIKQSVMGEKPKVIIINETKIINEIWRLFNTVQEKEHRKK